MPQVPVYGGQQVATRPLQTPGQSVPDVSSGLLTASRNASATAEVFDQLAQRDASEKAFSTSAKLQQDWLTFDADARQKYRGQNVDQYKAEVDKWWAEAPQKYGQDLDPMAKRLANRAITQTQTQAMASSLHFWNSEKDRATDEAAAAAKTSEIQFATTTGTPEALAVARDKIKGVNANIAQRKGWTPEQLQLENTRDIGFMHVTQVNRLMQSDPAAAQSYFDQNKGEIPAPQQEALREKLTVVSATVDGQKASADIWARMGPRNDGQAVELDKMEAAAREQYPNDPARQKQTIADLRERTQAFNASEGERRAQNTNSAWAVYQQTNSLAQMRKSPAFLALPAGEQVKLTEAITDRQHMLWARGVEDQNRVDAAKAKQSFPAFLAYSDPTVLVTMSRAQVTALQPYLGNSLTDHLTTKWEALQSQAGKVQASIDQQDFNHIANEMGLNPYEAPGKQTKQQREQLGELKFRTEQLIDQAQRENGNKPLPREQKMDIVRREMATTVSKSTWFGASSEEVPVILLGPDDLAKVRVPAAERTALLARLQAGYAANPIPAYEPTEDNLKRLYLRSKSQAAQYIPAKK